jgi:predicted transcriptional regulator
MADEAQEQTQATVELATELTIAWLGNPNVRAMAEDVPAFLKSMHTTLGELSSNAPGNAAAAPEYTPAVSPRSSVKHDYIVSLITGQKFKSLKRHLASHGLTPTEYRERYGLKPDYPMVAPGYSEKRREVAKKLGLGRKPGQTRAKAAEAAPTPGAETAPAKAAPKRAAKPKAAKPAAAKRAPAKRGRPKKSEAPAAS